MDKWYGDGNYYYRGQVPGTWGRYFSGGGVSNIGKSISFGGPSGRDYDDYIKATGGYGISFMDWYNKRLAVAKSYGYQDLDEARKDGMVFKWKNTTAGIQNSAPVLIPGTNIIADIGETEISSKLILIFDTFYFHGVRVFVIPSLDGSAFTVPGTGIYIGKKDEYTLDLLRHEFGHVLQHNKWGKNIYTLVALASIISYNKWQNNSSNFNHNDTWTEWTANYLAYQYFNEPVGWNKKFYPLWPQNIRPGVWPPFADAPSDLFDNWLND
jgi:hypothetical protein